MKAPWNARNGRFSPLKAAVFAGLFVPAVWIIYLAATGTLDPRMTEMTHGADLWAIRFFTLSLLVRPLMRGARYPKLVAVRRMDIDRPAAHRFARDLANSLGLSNDLLIFGPESRAETQPLADAIMREMDTAPGSELALWLLGSADEWNLDRWPALKAAQRLAARGRRIRVFIDPKTLHGLDPAVRIELFGQAIKAGCQLETAPASLVGNKDRALAWVGTGSLGLAWASRDPASWPANSEWGGSGNSALVRGPHNLPPLGQPIDISTFLIEHERTAVVEIRGELNGKIEQFGTAFWSHIQRQSAALSDRVKANAPLQAIEYTDRYLNSPLPVRLLREVLKATPGANTSTQIHVTTADQLSASIGSAPNQIKHDWRLVDHRNAVLREMIGNDYPQHFGLSTHDKRRIPHGRILTLRYADRILRLRLDQGFGYWMPASFIPFAFSIHPYDQARDLERASLQLRLCSTRL